MLWGHLVPKWHNRKITNTKTKYLRYLCCRNGGRKISELELKIGVCLCPFVKFVFFPSTSTTCSPPPAIWGGHFSDLLPWRVMTRMARSTLTFSMLNGFFYSQSANRDSQAGRQFGLLSGGHWWKGQRKAHPGGFNTATLEELLRYFTDWNVPAESVWWCIGVGPIITASTGTLWDFRMRSWGRHSRCFGLVGWVQLHWSWSHGPLINTRIEYTRIHTSINTKT